MDSLKEIWAQVLAKIQTIPDYTDATFNLWFRDLKIETLILTLMTFGVLDNIIEVVLMEILNKGGKMSEVDCSNTD